MIRKFTTLVCLVALASGCAVEPEASCPDEPVRVLSLAEPMQSAVPHPAGDHTYYLLDNPESLQRVVAVGTTCQDDAVVVARGIYLEPAHLRLDPRDDDPTIACDLWHRFLRVDPTGERGPTLLLPLRLCQSAIPTAHGVLVTSHRDDAATLWLFPDFPDEASARRIGAASVGRVVGDAIVYATTPAQIRRHDLATGIDELVVADADPKFYTTDTHLLWFADADDDTHTVHLLELASGDERVLGEHDASDVDSWSFDASEHYVIHTSPWQAFELDGRAVPLPVPGKLSRVLPGPAYLSYDEDDGTTYYTRLGAGAPVVLDFTYPTEDEKVTIGLHPLLPDRIEYRADRTIRFIPIDGSPASQIDVVGFWPHWIDAEHLLMHRGDDLVTLHVPSGARTVVVENITNYTYTGDTLADGIHVLFVRDGVSEVWHYPASVLLVGP